MLNRLSMALLALVILPVVALADSQTVEPLVTVYKSPTCGCCSGWVSHLEDNGFQVNVVDQHDLSAIKAKHGITPRLQSCHTAMVEGYAIEGHVPAGDIRRLLLKKPAVLGLTAPGMPAMSPGMSSVEPKGYDVLTFDGAGNTAVFSRY